MYTYRCQAAVRTCPSISDSYRPPRRASAESRPIASKSRPTNLQTDYKSSQLQSLGMTNTSMFRHSATSRLFLETRPVRYSESGPQSSAGMGDRPARPSGLAVTSYCACDGFRAGVSPQLVYGIRQRTKAFPIRGNGTWHSLCAGGALHGLRSREHRELGCGTAAAGKDRYVPGVGLS